MTHSEFFQPFHKMQHQYLPNSSRAWKEETCRVLHEANTPINRESQQGDFHLPSVPAQGACMSIGRPRGSSRHHGSACLSLKLRFNIQKRCRIHYQLSGFSKKPTESCEAPSVKAGKNHFESKASPHLTPTNTRSLYTATVLLALIRAVRQE